MQFDALEAELNRYPSERVLECLHGLHERPVRASPNQRGPAGGGFILRSPGFAARRSGVSIDASSPGKFRLRVSVVQRGCGFYDELEGTEAGTFGVARALLARLKERGVEPLC